MHLKRWITALILVPLLVGILLWGSPLVFTLLVMAIAILGLREYFRIVTPDLTGDAPPDHQTGHPECAIQSGVPGVPTADASGREVPGEKMPGKRRGIRARITERIRKQVSTWVHCIAFAAAVIMILAAHFSTISLLMVTPALNILALSFVILVVYSDQPSILSTIEKQIQGVIYVPLFLSFMVLVRNSDNGGMWILWLWLVVAASDTGAFYVGRHRGRRPLSPAISPKKTREGALGGLATAVVVGGGFAGLFVPEISFIGAVLFSVLCAVAGQVGDLFESALKRSGNIKDSGRLLPGHGGVLDRLDGVIFAAPVAYLFRMLVA